MNILSLDFETYYDREYSLKKMTMIEYIMDARFQPIVLSYAWNNEPVQRLYGFKQMKEFVDSVDWNNVLLCCQNTQFDASILALRFGKYARAYTDTMAMARVTGAHIVAGGASLEKIAELLISLGYPIPPKGKAVASASGKRLFNGWAPDKPFYLAEERTSSTVEMNEAVELLEAYGQYCDNDVELTRQAFNYFRTLITPQEMAYGDMILKCYIQSQFELDLPIIQEEIRRIEQRDKEKIQNVADKYFGGSVESMRSTMRSAPKFTQFLKSIGGVLPYEVDNKLAEQIYRFEIPYKYSEKKGKYEPCYSKSHAPMIEMLDSQDDELVTIFEMKLALTSSIEMSRAKTFERIAKLQCGFPIPYLVSGAHTHRLSGGSGGGAKGYNPQNLASGRKAGQSNALRRSIKAPDGFTTVCIDSSQIELRTGAFIAGDKSTLDLFVQKKDPYSVQASIIYGGDPDEIKRLAKAGVEPYASTQRPVAKSSLLSCIYGTGAGGFQNYLKVNGIDMDLEECKNIVQVYRQSHPDIVSIWRECERALKGMMAGTDGYFGGSDGKLLYYSGSRKVHGRTVPGIRLPDGNWINYAGLHVAQRQMPDGSVKDNLAYWGFKEGRAKWIYTYASKVFENCIAYGTEVLTDRGWVEIQNIKDTDRIFDGVEFVTHGGLLFKSIQPCVSIDGVYMTKDHEVLTNDGWKQAQTILLSERKTSLIQRLNWAEIWLAYCKRALQIQWKNMVLDFPMRLWWYLYKNRDTCYKGCKGGSHIKLRVHNKVSDCEKEYIARGKQTSNICGMAVNESTLYQSEPQNVEELRGSWYNRLPRMVRRFRELSTRYVTNISEWFGFRSDRQQWQLHERELSLGYEGAKLCEQTQKYFHTRRRPVTDNHRVWQEVRSESNDHHVQTSTWRNNARAGAQTEFYKQVYDIKDCGKRHRFVVRGNEQPFIVHNCNQGLAFSVMKYQAMLINKRYRIAGNTHDEWFIVVPEDEAESAFKYMEWCMRQVPPWAKGLPLDCEGTYAKHYGDC